MFYIIQENVFREQHYDMLEKSLNRMGLPHVKVRIFPFVDKIAKLEDIPEGVEDLTVQDFHSGNYNVDDLPEFDPGRNNQGKTTQT